VSQHAVAQENDESVLYVVFRKTHWNFENEEGNYERWMELEKAYHENVVMKNELIVGTQVFTHHYSPDNSEVFFVTAYANWEDILNAGDRNWELTQEAWPDEDERRAFFQERNSYTLNRHSDEIYVTVPNNKSVQATGSEPMLVYIQTHKMSFDFGENWGDKRTEYIEHVIHTDPLIKGFYNLRHMYGSDNRDLLEIYFYDNMADMNASLQGRWNLVETHWPDEEERMAFFKEYGGWNTGHSDAFYMNFPELAKSSSAGSE
jgi:hypothetical protein